MTSIDATETANYTIISALVIGLFTLTAGILLKTSINYILF